MNAVPALLPVSAAPERVLLCLPEVGEDIGGVLYWPRVFLWYPLEPAHKKEKEESEALSEPIITYV